MRLFLDANVLFTAAHNPNGKAALVTPGDRTVVDSAGNLVIRIHDGAGAGRPSASIDTPPPRIK